MNNTSFRAQMIKPLLGGWLLATILGAGSPTAAQQDAGLWDAGAEEGSRQKWALLIGVNKYSELRGLVYCRDDMQALSKRLIAAGFPAQNVFLLADGAAEPKYLPFKANIERQLELVLNLAERDDLLVVAFSGHGTHLGGASYLCPAEARLEAPQSTMVPMDLVYERLNACRARWKLLLVDACRNDPRPEGLKDTGAALKSVYDFAAALAKPPQGILALTSCAVGETSLEAGEFGHGVFMHYFLDGLNGKADREEGNHNGRVSLLELYRYTNVNTKRYVAQMHHRVQTPLLRGEIPGDYEITAAAADPKVFAALAQGDEHCRAGRFDQGLAAFSAALRIDPNYAAAYEKRALAHSGKRDYTAAIMDLTMAIHIDPQPGFYTQRSAAYGRSRDFQKALADANEALRLDPHLAKGYNHRGVAYRRLGNHERALADFSEALRIDPKYDTAYTNRGCIYASRRETTKALADFDAALQLDPKHSSAYYFRGMTRCEHGDYQQARADFETAIRLKPDYASPYTGRGMAYRHLGELDKALTDFQTALERDPTSAYAYRQRGQLYRQKHDLDHAIQDFSAAIRLEPRNAAAYSERGCAYGDKREFALAIADFSAALRIQPRSSNYYHNRALAYRRKGDLEQALADANEALRLDPKNVLAYGNRARIYRAQGHTERAAADEAQAKKLQATPRN